ncbi:PilZ domain-containing protein [Azomonas macrocytogenes]|uniref:PilZ domain-containing protein n=1 Tax=Azomonas macrocytogenes TaxID=69962 RepID=A0A839SZI5_AZOMA|nr:PilZ domain-containing protein [Azomonas macrocytogenes]MBB3101690.1 hypothetical protein [Azomonas macrocytogenes]
MAANIVSSEELAFINTLMNSTTQTVTQPSLGFRIDGNSRTRTLLATLACRSTLSLEAEFGRFCLSFPLELSEDEFHSQHLHMASPIIYEHGPRLRAWRLLLPQPLTLLNAEGDESMLRVHELSPYGLLVDTVAEQEPPERFYLYLPLPGDTPMPITAHRVRTTENGMIAYGFDFSSEEDAERLRCFLFSQHRNLYPELQPEIPDDLV